MFNECRDFSYLKEGDKIFVDVGKTLILTKVIRVTPTGRIRTAKYPNTFFDKTGREMNSDPWAHHYHLSPWSQEQEDYLVQKRLEREAKMKARALVNSDDLTYEKAVEIMKIMEDY